MDLTLKILVTVTLTWLCISQETKNSPHKPLQIYNLTEIVYEHTDEIIDSDLLEDKQFIEDTKMKTKIAACLLIMRSSFGKGNKEVIQTLKETKHDKTKTYEKIQAMMLEHCVGKIEDSTIENVLHPDKFALWEESYSELLKFNKNIFQIIGPDVKYSTSEKELIDKINDIVAHPGPDPVKEETLDFLTEKLGVYKYLVYGYSMGSLTFLGLLVLKNAICRQ